MTAFALGALVLSFAVWARALTILHRWREVHHWQVGAGMVALALRFATYDDAPGWVRAVAWALVAVGLWFCWDDALAHHAQAQDETFPRSGPRGWLDARYSLVHRLAHRAGLI